MILRITKYGEAILTKKGKKITEFDDKLIELSNDMLDTMYEKDGIGLAAQQVGKALQLCVIDLYYGTEDVDFNYSVDGKRSPLELIMPMELCNPEIELLTGDQSTTEEGCLSFPEIRGDVKRPDTIRVTYQDIYGDTHTLDCNGLFSRCVQHEYDHLHGTLFIDRMSKKQLKELSPKLKSLKKESK